MEHIDLDVVGPADISGAEPEVVQTLLHLGDVLLSAMSLGDFADDFLEEIAAVAGASGAVLYLTDSQEALSPFARIGPITTQEIDSFCAADGLAARSVRENRWIVVSGDECLTFLPADGDGKKQAVPTALLALPLRDGERLVAAVVCTTTAPSGFKPSGLKTLRAIGTDRLAKALGVVHNINIAAVEAERAHARVTASRLLMATADPQERLHQMAEQLARISGVSRCFIFELVDDGQEIVAASGSTAQQFDDMRRALEGTIEQPGLGLEKIVATQAPATMSQDDALADKPFAEAIEMYSALVVPLVYGGQVAGLAYLDEPGKKTVFTLVQIDALESVSDVAALATHSAQLQRRIAEKAAMERHRDRLSALHYLLNQSRIIVDEQDLVGMLPRAISDVLGYDRVYLYVVRGGRFDFASGYFRRRDKDFEKFAARARKYPPKIGEPTIEVEVYRHGNAQIVANPSADPRVIRQHQKVFQSTSMAVVPLWGTQEVNGILVADYKYQDVAVTEEDVALLSLLGTGVGASLEMVRLYETARRDRDKLATLLANSDDAILIVDRDREILAFNKASERLSGVKASDAIGKMCQEVWKCCDEEGRELGPQRCPVLARIDGRIPEDTTYMERVLRRLDGQQVDVAATYAYVEGPDGQVEQGMEILRDLTEHKRWMREHYIANTLQKALLPEAPPKNLGVDIGVVYDSATSQAAVGGDFYDFISLPDGRLGIVIGDVCGKGIDAAHYTAMTKYTLRAYLMEGAPLPVVTARLNDTMAAQVTPGEFISMCFGVLDLERKTFTCVNAGHPHPLFLHGTDGWQPLDKGGMVLGVVPGQWYEEEKIQLAPGDTVLFYTDGLIETKRGGVTFGEERLLQFLKRCRVTTAQQFAERIYQRSATYSGGHLDDDVAVVAVRL